ncbi:MAG: sigma-70 family RNA polymerase sigma factor [Lactobacillaceae bacterium]|jgi:RNA polymerase sigma-70 factor (ECF subfamily)|nr:sigma-70 family RNA polymerase sigma factor [Lactobacillaceae bacterium]
MKQIIENKGRIRAIIKKLTGSYNEDVEQEVYIKAWKSMDSYKEEGKFSQWIGILTANVCRDYFKSRQYKASQKQVDGEVLEKVAVGGRQEEALDAKRRQKIILKAVGSLPRKMRKIVILFEFEELSYEEIAKKTGLPVGTIKSRLFNARKILNEKLKFLKGE